ncbi:MAG: hypothetical protein WAS05_08745 [Candidatus Nanopelagicales bacterium]
MVKAKKQVSRSKLVAAGAGVLVASMVFASAATLGNVSNAALGSSSAPVASCDSDGFNIGWGDFFVPKGSSAFVYNKALISGISDTCNGQKFNFSVIDAEDQVIARVSDILTVEKGKSVIALPEVTVSKVRSVSMVIGA